jgi:hypothetical protein
MSAAYSQFIVLNPGFNVALARPDGDPLPLPLPSVDPKRASSVIATAAAVAAQPPAAAAPAYNWMARSAGSGRSVPAVAAEPEVCFALTRQVDVTT